jgi:hypothetical protein
MLSEMLECRGGGCGFGGSTIVYAVVLSEWIAR